MGKWGTTAGKVVGPLVVIGQMTYELYNAQQTEKEERRALVRHIQAIQDAVNDIIRDLHSSYRSNIAMLVENIFHPIDIWMDDQKAAEAKELSTFQQENLLLTQAKMTLQKV